MTPWIPTPSCYVTTENETCDNQTRRYESYRTPLLCPIHLENFHTVILTSDPRSSRGNGDTDALLLVRVTLWKLAWYNHNRRLADRSCTPLPRLLRRLILAHSFTLHFSQFTFYSSPASFVGDSSHSSPPGDVDTGFVGDDSGPPVVLPMRLDTLPRSTVILRPITNTKTARISTVAGDSVTPAEVVEPAPVATPPTPPTFRALSYTTLE